MFLPCNDRRRHHVHMGGAGTLTRGWQCTRVRDVTSVSDWEGEVLNVSSQEICGLKCCFGAFWGLKHQVISAFHSKVVQRTNFTVLGRVRRPPQTPLNDHTDIGGTADGVAGSKVQEGEGGSSKFVSRWL